MHEQVEKPIGVAIIICDKVITEAGTGNKTLVGTFNNITATVVPCVQPRMSVYVALSNSSGVKEISLQLKAPNDQTMFKTGGKVTFPDPNAVVDAIFNIIGLPLIEFGVYCFEVYVNEEFIFESRFTVTKQKA